MNFHQGDKPSKGNGSLNTNRDTKTHHQDSKPDLLPVVILMSQLAIAAAKDLNMIQLDIKTAFLNGDLDEEIYMIQPEGFITPGREKEVCHLRKSIYGLKQASRAWSKKIQRVSFIFWTHKKSGRLVRILSSHSSRRTRGGIYDLHMLCR